MPAFSALVSQAWGALDSEQRVHLASLLNSYALLLESLGANRLPVLQSEVDSQQLSAWLDATDAAAQLVNGPTGTQLYSSQEAPSWSVVIGAWQGREPRVANALQELQRSYQQFRSQGGMIASQLGDGGVRAWAWDRAGRERATGPGAGAPRTSRRRGTGMEVLLILVFVWLAWGRSSSRGG